MTYQVDFPPDLERRLSAKATQTGQGVVDIIQTAVVQFMEEDTDVPSNGSDTWSDAKDARRCDLIDRDIAGTISESERAELMRLEAQANEYFDQIAPPPIKGMQRLHQQLLLNRARRSQ
jgi:hypothetical protein